MRSRLCTGPGRQPPARRRGQRGAALLTAMLIVVLVTTLASAMVWQQWRAVQVEAAERARTQAAWILSGALDWARLILREDARSGGATTLNEPWATPLAEARLSSFLAADKSNADDGPEAFLSGAIADAQARYNLRNLVDAAGKVIPLEVAALQRLCESIGVSPDAATRIVSGLRGALSREDRPASPPLMPRYVSQLAWFGVDAASLQRLTPYVVILPISTPVNLNTASREVIAASIEGMDVGVAERLVEIRKRTPFKTVAEAQASLPANLTIDSTRAGVLSQFFEVRGRVRLGDRMLEELSLVERRGTDIVSLQRQRFSLQEAGR
ncbi:MAG: type II secretion system minor pseudopilin GspK [Rhizobacter sp.]